MDRPWYEKPMRIAALQCNYEGGKTLEVAGRWGQLGFNVEQLFHPMADGYSALFDPAAHSDLLRRYIERAKSNGLRIIVYLNVHILGPSQAEHRDAWAQRDADGGFPLSYETYYACCVNSPWRDHFFSVLDALAPFDIDGVFLDGPANARGGCRCAACAARFQGEHGGDINKARKPELDRFWAGSRDAFLSESYHRFKAIKPDGLHYMNLGLLHAGASAISVPRALEYNDIVGTEGGFMFYGPPARAPLWKPSTAAKVLEAAAPDKPRVVFMAGDQKPWSWYTHTPAETRLCIASIVANGANLWYGLHGSTRLLDTPGGRAAGEMVRFLADHESAYDATRSASRVAVMFSFDTERSYRSSPVQSDLYGEGDTAAEFPGDFQAAFHGVCSALARSGVPFDAVTDLEGSLDELGRYHCLFLPTCACLADRTVDALRRYVAEGGALVASFDTSLYDGEGARRPDFALADVFGASTEGEVIHHQNWNYISACAEHDLFEGITVPLLPAAELALDVRAGDGAEVLARLHGVMAGRYVDLTPPQGPAIVLNRFGRGVSLYLAGAVGEMCDSYSPPEYRRLLWNAAGLFATSPVVLEGAAGNVEVVARAAGDRLVVHLVNYAGLVPRPFEAVVPQCGLRLRVPADAGYSQAQALAAGEPCSCFSQQGDLMVGVPELHEYEVVVVS